MGLSLLTVALESGSHHIGTFPSLMNYVKDDMCKNLFWVGILWKSEIEANSGLGKGKRRLKYKTMKKKNMNSFICMYWSAGPGCFLVLQKLLLVSYCIVVWQYFSVLCIMSLLIAPVYTPRNYYPARGITCTICASLRKISAAEPPWCEESHFSLHTGRSCHQNCL